MNCRHCKVLLTETFLDLGFAPPSNNYLKESDLSRPEKYFPLKIMVCKNCWLVQTQDYTKADELFNPDYAYFSSTSVSFLAHAKNFADTLTKSLGLNKSSFVIEVASNDGYLLKNFVNSYIPCLGIEPTSSTARAAEKLGIPVLQEFFGAETAKKLAAEDKLADLIVGNNVYAHVPDINDFTLGLKAVLKPAGTITLEFPHLMKLISLNQFDTIYHEHFSYLSLNTVNYIFKASGLRIFDVEKLSTHGGSLRIFGCHSEDKRITRETVPNLLYEEEQFGLKSLKTYQGFQERADEVKNELIEFLVKQFHSGKKVVAYGAAAKGNTLLNYAGIKPDLLSEIYDASSSKQGKYMPGSHIPIKAPSDLNPIDTDYVLILPWNIASEIINQNIALLDHGVQFITAIPKIKYFP